MTPTATTATATTYRLWHRYPRTRCWYMIHSGTEAECRQAMHTKIDAGDKGDWYVGRSGINPNVCER